MMMRNAVLVLNIFAVMWCAAGVIAAGLPLAALVVPVVISAALILWVRRWPEPMRSAEDRARIGRLIGRWSAVEGIAIFVAITICRKIGLVDAAGPVIAIVVGLHFIPLARGIPVPLYYATGVGLVLIGVGALLLPGQERLEVTGFASAIILWVCCAALIRASRNAVRANPSALF